MKKMALLYIFLAGCGRLFGSQHPKASPPHFCSPQLSVMSGKIFPSFYVLMTLVLNVSVPIKISTFIIIKCGWLTVLNAGGGPPTPPQHCSQHNFLHGQTLHTS